MWAHLRAAGLILLCAWPVAAQAQDWPTKPIRLVVPFPPGGPNDVIGRVVGQKMQDLLGQLVIIDNRAGAGGALGTDFVAKSEPDGYTIAIASAGALAISYSLQDKILYDPLKDLALITLVAKVPELLVASTDVPVSSRRGARRARQGEARPDQFRLDRRRQHAPSRRRAVAHQCRHQDRARARIAAPRRR